MAEEAKMETNGLIYQKIPAIMADISAIGKDRKNTQQNYAFRGIDDVYNAVHDVFAKHKVFTTSEILSEASEERETKSGGNLIYRILKIRYRFWAEDGSSVVSEVIGEGMDTGDKASNKAMAVAHKYLILQALCIPTDEPKDPENEHHEVKAKHSVAQKLIPPGDTKIIDTETTEGLRKEAITLATMLSDAQLITNEEFEEMVKTAREKKTVGTLEKVVARIREIKKERENKAAANSGEIIF